MRAAAAEERFEDAARYRNRLHAVERLAERQAVERASIGTIDVIGLAVGAERAAVQVFPLRGGRMVDRYSFHLENAGGRRPARGARGLLPRVLRHGAVAAAADPRPARPRRPRRRSPAFLSELRGSRVEVRAPERGEKRRLQELAQQQRRARALLASRSSPRRSGCARVEALEELREVLNLEALPLRIECFDISNIQGQEIVGSMVVFEDGVARKAHYRKFAIRGQAGQDDFAAMAEVVARRFARLAAGARRRATTTSRSPSTPNLVVIDGGKGQLARRARGDGAPTTCRASRWSRSPSGSRRSSCPSRPRPVLLPDHSPGLQLLQRAPRRGAPLRAHLPPHPPRPQRARESMFDQLDGVGPVRRRALLRHFGSAERVLDGQRRGARGRPGRAGEDRPSDLRPAAPGRRRLASMPPMARPSPPGGLPGRAAPPRAPARGRRCSPAAAAARASRPTTSTQTQPVPSPAAAMRR